MIRFEILGTVDLKTADGATADAFLKQPKAVGLLAFLALSRPHGFVRRDVLLGMLWPDLDQTSARKALSSQLYRVRQQLGQEAFESRGTDEVALGADVWCDAAEFRRLLAEGSTEAALELYRGPLLPGLYVPTADNFERWLDEERMALTRMAREGAWAVTEEARSAGDLPRAIRWARQALAISPHDEPGFRRLLSLFAAAGNRAGALQAYEAFARLLQREYEIEPDAETQALIRQISRSQPPGDASPPGPIAPGSPARAAGPEVQPLSARMPAGPVPPVVPGLPADEVGGVGSPLTEAVGETPPDSSIPGTSDSPIIAGASPARRGPQRVHGFQAWLAVAVVIVLAGLAAFWQMRPGRGISEKASVPRVAILYLDVDSTNPALRDRADALTEALIARLSGSEQLAVVSSAAVRAFNSADAHRAVLERLAPTYVVHGSMRTDGDQVRVHVELMDAATGTNGFSTEIDRDTASLFELTDELVREISTMLRMELGKEVKLASWYSAAANPEAARMLNMAALSRVGAARVRELNDLVAERRLLLESDSFALEASKRDRAWPEPDVFRAYNARRLFWNAFARNEPTLKTQALIRGIEAATAALEKEPDFAPALEIRGYLLTFGWADGGLPDEMERTALSDAEKDLRRATGLDPRRSTAWASLSYVLGYQNNLQEALLAAERAYETDAFMEGWPTVLSSLFSASFDLKRFDDAETWCREMERRLQSDWGPAYCRLMIEAYMPAKPGGVQEAWRIAREATLKVHESRRPSIQVILEPLVAAIIARHEMPDSAAHVLEAVYRRKAANPECLRLVAATWHAMGETDRAMRILNEYANGRNRPTQDYRHWLFEGLVAPVPDQQLIRR